MVKQQAEYGYTEDDILFRRDTQLLNVETFEFKQEDMPFLVGVLKEMYPKVNLNNYTILKTIANKEFGGNYTESDFRRYFSPSIEGIEDEYRYKQMMAE